MSEHPPRCLVSPEGSPWLDDPVVLHDAASAWLERQTMGSPTVEHVLIPGPDSPSLADWLHRARPAVVVALKARGRLGRLITADAAAHLPRALDSAVRLVREPQRRLPRGSNLP